MEARAPRPCADDTRSVISERGPHEVAAWVPQVRAALWR